MLSDRERATLHEIQGQFLAEDPGFAQTFDADPPDLPVRRVCQSMSSGAGTRS